MFYYRIKITHPCGGRNTVYMEALNTVYVGEKVAKLLSQRLPERIVVEPINQRDYMAATRPKD